MASVTEYYTNKAILVTGATGFIGKLLVEKLLRSCPVETVYIMMRPKKGQGLKMRLQQFVASRVFDHIRPSGVLDKLRAVRGDVQLEALGLSEEDRRLLRTCHIVFHSAACVKFDTFIRDAVDMNVVGTQRMLELAETMDNLEAFVHLSTSYCRSDVASLEERLYRAKHNPRDVIQCTQWMDHDTLKAIETKLISPQPNTYSYTKSLAEQLVSEYKGKFPIAIARPSIVTASLKEPFPGWVDNLNGPTGIIVGAAKGVVRSMLCDETSYVDAMPADLVVNGCILLAYTTGLQRPKEIVVCNIARSDSNPITWGDSVELARKYVKDYPFTIPLWYPGGSPKKSELSHQLAVLFTHMIPAYLVDFCLILLGKKPFLVNTHKRINNGMKVLQYYTLKSWHFRNEQYLELRTHISEEEDRVFYTDPKAMDWPSYIKNYLKGAREYCCGEDPATLPQARKLHIRLYYLDLFVKIMFTLAVCYFVCMAGLRAYNRL